MNATTPSTTISDSRYLARCQATLKAWGAPLAGWQCIQMIDYANQAGQGLTTCQLCGCTIVRFVHVMTHENYFEDIEVGCICAGVMEGDELAARERERSMRNRAKRRQTFIKKPWRTLANGNQMIRHKDTPSS